MASGLASLKEDLQLLEQRGDLGVELLLVPTQVETPLGPLALLLSNLDPSVQIVSPLCLRPFASSGASSFFTGETLTLTSTVSPCATLKGLCPSPGSLRAKISWGPPWPVSQLVSKPASQLAS